MKVVRIIPSLALVAYLTLVFASGRGLVLCTGVDGHVALEVASGAASCAMPDSTEDCSDTGLSESHCGPCDDTPLLIEAHGVRTVQTAPAPDVSSVVLPVLESIPAASYSLPQRWTFTAASFGEFPASLRTTVLLI